MPIHEVLDSISRARAQIVDQLSASVAAVILGRRRTLSGIAVSDDLILTAAEPVAGAEQLTVRPGDADLPASVVATDLTTDIAALSVPGHGLKPVTLSKRAPDTGESVALVGRERQGVRAAWGSVALVGPAWRSRRGGDLARRLEFDVRMSHLLEGAAVADTRGGVIAMAVEGAYGRVLGIPAETLERVALTVRERGFMPQPYLGLRLQPLWLDESARQTLNRAGAHVPIVAGIDPGSPAAAADLALGDWLLGVDGTPVDGIAALAARLTRATPGAPLTLEVLRGGAARSVSLAVGERPRR